MTFLDAMLLYEGTKWRPKTSADRYLHKYQRDKTYTCSVVLCEPGMASNSFHIGGDSPGDPVFMLTCGFTVLGPFNETSIKQLFKRKNRKSLNNKE